MSICLNQAGETKTNHCRPTLRPPSIQSCGKILAFHIWQLWGNWKFLHRWRNFRCLNMGDMEKSEILHIWHVCDVEDVAICAKFMRFSCGEKLNSKVHLWTQWQILGLLLVTGICAGIYGLSVLMGNQFSTDNLAKVGPSKWLQWETPMKPKKTSVKKNSAKNRYFWSKNSNYCHFWTILSRKFCSPILSSMTGIWKCLKSMEPNCSVVSAHIHESSFADLQCV